MKNFWKILGIIALVAIIGFSMAACGDDDDDPDTTGTETPGTDTPGTDTPSTAVKWPEELRGKQFTKTGTNYSKPSVKFQAMEGGSDTFTYTPATGYAKLPSPTLCKVEGKKFTVKYNDFEHIIITDYTLTDDGKLTLTIGDSEYVDDIPTEELTLVQ